MKITMTWNDFKQLYPDKGLSVMYLKTGNDVHTVVVGFLDGPDKVFILTNGPNQGQFIQEFPNSQEVSAIEP